MKIILYRVFINNDKWMERVVDDFRWICRSGLFKGCDKLHIDVPEGKANDMFSGEEWVRYFWGRIGPEISKANFSPSLSSGYKVEIQTHSKYNESDVLEWISNYPNDNVIYVGSNGALGC